MWNNIYCFDVVCGRLFLFLIKLRFSENILKIYNLYMNGREIGIIKMELI